MPKFDNTPYTQLTSPARGDVQGVIKDISEALPENQTKYATQEDLHQFGSWASKVRSVTASGTVTIANTDPMFVEIDPNGSDRDVNFPAKSDDNHGYYMRHSGSANTLTLKRSGGATITTLSVGELKYIMPSTLNDFSAHSGERETAYKITPTVSANDLILTLTHMDGTTPSTSRPLWFQIGSTWRAVTAALSRTLADGTNWFASGAAELGTKAIDYFAYVVWDSNSSAVGLTYARVPYADVVSNFSSTSTNERYCAGYSDFTSTDDVVNIGRFEATLSLAATSYLWTVPTYTSANLIQRPTYWTRWLSWSPQKTGYTNDPTGGTGVYNYMINGKSLFFSYADTGNATSNLTTKTATLPMAAATVSGMTWNFTFRGFDNGAQLTTPALAQISSAGNTLSFFKDMSGAAWTGSGNHRMPGGTLWYPIEN